MMVGLVGLVALISFTRTTEAFMGGGVGVEIPHTAAAGRR